MLFTAYFMIRCRSVFRIYGRTYWSRQRELLSNVKQLH